MEPTLIRGGKFPTHNFGVRADEKVRERHGRNRNVGLGHPPLPIPAVCLGTLIGRSCGHIENLDAPTAYPVGGSRRVRVANTNLGQTHRIDGGTVTRSTGGRGVPTDNKVKCVYKICAPWILLIHSVLRAHSFKPSRVLKCDFLSLTRLQNMSIL